jgi:quercetin dioxygenase-like cupin family protein
MVILWETIIKECLVMKTKDIAGCIANGTITFTDKVMQADTIDWVAHPSFEGVYLKHLIQGADTQGQLSCHMVKIDPGCILETHTHAEQWELHEVIAGEGNCVLDGSPLPYAAGQMTVIPCDTPHAVEAGDNGLVLLAKFFPALL